MRWGPVKVVDWLLLWTGFKLKSIVGCVCELKENKFGSTQKFINR